jgi:hypothetical protein
MAARALVAYERPDGRYNVHYAHRGAEDGLADRLSPATPFGGPDRRAEWAAGLLRELLTTVDCDSDTVAGRVPDGAAPAVDPLPLAVGVPRGSLPGRVAFGVHEACLVVDRAFAVTPYLAVPFDLAPVADRVAGTAVDPAGGGALVPVDEGTSLGALRERAAGARAALGTAVDGGLAPAAATTALRATLARWVGADRLLVADHGDERDVAP